VTGTEDPVVIRKILDHLKEKRTNARRGSVTRESDAADRPVHLIPKPDRLIQGAVP